MKNKGNAAVTRSCKSYKTGWRVLLMFAVLESAAGCTRDPAVRKQKYLASGDRYFQQKRYKEATIEYRNAIQIDSHFGEAYYRLGLSLLEVGHVNFAAQAFVRAVEYAPDMIDARLRLGSLFVAAGEFSDARMQAEEVLNRDSKNSSAHLLLGQIQLQQRKYPEAKVEFEEAMKLAPESPVPPGNLGLAELLNGEFDVAEKNFQKAVELDKDDPQPKINLANFYRSRQQPDRAEQVLRQGIAQNAQAMSLPLALADLYFYQGRSAEAKNVLGQIEADEKNSPDARRKVADFFILQGDAASALERYLPLTQKNASDKSLGMNVAECYLKLGRWLEAEQWIDKYDKKSEDPEFQIMRARAHLGEFRVRDSISELQDLIQKDPSSASAHFYLAQAYLQKGDLQGAKNALVEALQTKPGYIPALLGLGDISVQQNDPEVALQYANQLISQSYWLVNAHLIAGNAYALRRDLTSAQREFEIAVALNSRNPAALERLGRVLSALGKYREAEKAYEEALNADPANGQALSGLVENSTKEGKADQVRVRIEQQIVRQPRSFQLQMVRGEFCLSRGDWACSEQSFQEAQILNPYEVTTYFSLARLYATTKRVDDALKQYERARQKFPDFLPAYIQLGLAYEGRGDFESAKQSYQKALQIDPNFAPAQNNLAWLYCEHGGSLEQALELAQRAQKQQPDDPHINDTLAWIYYKKGLYPSAAQLLESAVAKSRQSSEMQFHLGMVYLAQGKRELCRKTLQTALQLGLSLDKAKDAHEALRKLTS